MKVARVDRRQSQRLCRRTATHAITAGKRAELTPVDGQLGGPAVADEELELLVLAEHERTIEQHVG